MHLLGAGPNEYVTHDISFLSKYQCYLPDSSLDMNIGAVGFVQLRNSRTTNCVQKNAQLKPKSSTKKKLFPKHFLIMLKHGI